MDQSSPARPHPFGCAKPQSTLQAIRPERKTSSNVKKGSVKMLFIHSVHWKISSFHKTGLTVQDFTINHEYVESKCAKDVFWFSMVSDAHDIQHTHAVVLHEGQPWKQYFYFCFVVHFYFVNISARIGSVPKQKLLLKQMKAKQAPNMVLVISPGQCKASGESAKIQSGGVMWSRNAVSK